MTARSFIREFSQTTDSFLIHRAASPSVLKPSIRSAVPSGSVARTQKPPPIRQFINFERNFRLALALASNASGV